jgi:hypothetical protein
MVQGEDYLKSQGGIGLSFTCIYMLIRVSNIRDTSLPQNSTNFMLLKDASHATRSLSGTMLRWRVFAASGRLAIGEPGWRTVMPIILFD